MTRRTDDADREPGREARKGRCRRGETRRWDWDAHEDGEEKALLTLNDLQTDRQGRSTASREQVIV